MIPKSTYLFFSDYDTDLNQYSYLKFPDFGPENATIWRKGFLL